MYFFLLKLKTFISDCKSCKHLNKTREAFEINLFSSALYMYVHLTTKEHD